MKVGTCAIILDINDTTPDKSVTVPMAVVIKAVRLILRMCVSLPPPPGIGMGGFTEIYSPDGSGGILDVIVMGRYSEPEPPPPFLQGSTMFRPSI